jgi:hypothetical protein
MITRSDALADALERLDGFAYLDAPGFANHGPMGAETLSSLGHNDLLASWTEQYCKRHDPLPAPPAHRRIDPADDGAIRSALGDPSRVSDWEDLFSDELWERPWPDVVGQWAPRLLPGYAGALTHGLIRTAHAVRAMPADGPSAPVRYELAKGLALWAASYRILPGQPKNDGWRSLPEAVARLPRPAQPWPLVEAGSFAHIDELNGFVQAVEAVATPAEPVGHVLSSLSAAFCRVLLEHANVFAVPLVHTVTPIAAARTLLPYLPTSAVDTLVARLWHVGAAITVSFTPTAPSPSVALDADPPGPQELIARAVTHQDPHVLKFSDACVREYALSPDPVYLQAAQHVLGQLAPW